MVDRPCLILCFVLWLVLCLILCLILFYQTTKFITMVDRACLVPAIILLSILLLADIGLMSGIASYRRGLIPRITNDDAHDPESIARTCHFTDDCYWYIGILAIGIIVISMLTLPLICTPRSNSPPTQHPRAGQV